MGFLHLFWGFLFLIDIRINGFDILPDVVGYVLFFLGFIKLESKSQHFLKAKNMSVVMIILSVMSLVISWASLQSWLFYFLFNVVLYILKLYIVFHLCYGISELAGRRGLHEFQNKAIQRWRWYIIVMTAAFLILLIAPLAPLLAVILGILLILASLVIYILMMLLTLEAEQVLHR
ncbi:hypothetical protein P4H66_11165 [Paenibacillus dokdonensis]|uniref:Uncharacterized protein n=1 Tax=Paenibacillus dokdonensis TaxID=2567944 RepID=A0ABU6GKY8_9BACL|nr:hypothetical protein [Paenibacillus dokdonensis]MEC0240411.1 hypothetical protein [Paenibacillus dokdonensis]